MGRKVFISFLGFSDYKPCKYQKGDFTSENVRFTQTATLDYLQTIEEWTENDAAYFLLTKGAKESNWVDDATKKREGLETILKKKMYAFHTHSLENLPDGKDEKELFEIFKSIYSVLQHEDILYFDITHGFRSLPMLALVLVNYAKFLKNIEVRSITYGNFEARTNLGEETIAPIIDLLPLSQIQDWTFATADFLKNGNADQYEELVKAYRKSVFTGYRVGDRKEAEALEKLTRSLRKVIDDFQTCRGENIIRAKNMDSLQSNIKELGMTVIEPLNPVLKKMEEAFGKFNSSSNCLNGFDAAKWCIEHNLYQQAATILQESVVTFFCEKYKMDIKKDSERKYVNMAFAFSYKLKNKETSETNKNKIRKEIDESEALKALMEDELLKRQEVIDAFNKLTHERNDLNHNGMREQPHASDVIKKNIRNAFEALLGQFKKEDF